MVNALLWALQAPLALLFLFSGARKLRRTEAQIRAVYWVRDTPTAVVRAIGVLEILGALGLIVPGLTGVWPWLTPLAALGLAGLMVGAAWVNYRVRAYLLLAANVVIGALAALIAYGRLAAG